MKGKKNTAKFIGAGALLLLLAAGFLWCAKTFLFPGEKTDNLARMAGVKVSCDSVENEKFSAQKVIDGDIKGAESRWSSENNRENAHHYVQLEFPREVTLSYVVLYWERLNVTDYGIEGSKDGVNFEVLQHFDRVPATNRQEIVLEHPAELKFLRVFTDSVLQREEDLTIYYQNVSLYEVEAYEKAPAAYGLEAPRIVTKEDGSRYLEHPQAPEGYETEFLGADLEQIIGEDGTVYDTIEEKTVTVGYRVKPLGAEDGAVEKAFSIEVPAAKRENTEEDNLQENSLRENNLQKTQNECPVVVPELAEWRGGEGMFQYTAQTSLVVAQEVWSKELEDSLQQLLTAVGKGTEKMVQEAIPEESARTPGVIYLLPASDNSGLGEEGYFLSIGESCVLSACDMVGFRYGLTTLLQLAGQNEGKIPCGEIRDYPLYKVRGFGIDVARKKVSMETLYDMLAMMSYYKMNDLQIHLNDNTILTTSGMTDTVEHAMEANSAFRLETEIANEKGEKLTASDYAYTREEFSRFIRDAKAYGIQVVPEFDTPAHSLAITRLFPEYALKNRNESVDQIDLSNGQAVALVRKVWEELLAGDNAAFAPAQTVHVGMDEYYGDGETFRQYMADTVTYVKSKGKTARLWGSLSNTAGTTMPDTEGVEMNLWSMDWADPTAMYQAGYQLINMQSNHLYLIPGGGYDYPDLEKLWTKWEPYRYFDEKHTEELPVYSKQLLGAAFMLWNDMSDSLDVGLCEYDLYQRFEETLPVFGDKCWGKSRTGKQPAHWIRLKKEDRLLPTYEIRLKVHLQGDSTPEEGDTGAGGLEQSDQEKEQVLAAGEGVYADWKFYAVEPETGKVGFTREGQTFTFAYTLPKDRVVELKLVGEPGSTSLYVDDKLIDTLGQDVPFAQHATFVFPLEKLGQETGSFQGTVELEGFETK